MKPILVTTAVMILVLGLAVTAPAQRKKSKPEEPKAKSELKLSEEQKQRLADIHRQGAKERIRLNAERQIARIELSELLQSDHADKAALDRKIDQLADLSRQMTQNRLHTMAESRSVLTREQWRALHRKMGKRMMLRGRERMRIFRFRGPGRGFGPGMDPDRPMGDESFEREGMMPDEKAEADQPGSFGLFDQPDYDMEFQPSENGPEFEMEFQAPPPSETGWQ